MRHSIRYALLLGAALIVGAGVAAAQMGEPRQPQLPGERPESSRGRFADRFLGEFDLNHDGKVTRDEFNKAVAKDFSDASHGQPTMSEDQFIASRTKDLRQRVTEMFHRSDWNGDGKLSFDEFAAPTRAAFERMDRDGTGVAMCSARRSVADETPPQRRGPPSQNSGRSRSTGGSRGRGGFCAEFDLNRDGKVTHAELDTGLHQQFQAATKGGQSMTLDQLYALELAHYREMDARIFQPEPMGLRERLLERPLDRRLLFDPETDTFFVNFEGLSVRSQADIERIRNLAAERLGGVGHKVRAIVDYENFTILPELLDSYSAMIADLSERFFSSATRYTTNAFLRVKLGDALRRCDLTPHLFETAGEARARHHANE